MAEVGRNVAPALWLRDVVLVMDVPHGTWTAYLNRYTYELVTISESDLVLPDWGDDDPEFREYQKRQVARARKVVKSEDFLKLPGRFEIRELDIMKSFCSTVEDLELKGSLLQALRGRDALGAFRNRVRERGVQVEWFRFREQALERVAADWLDANGIAYRRD
jgi:hypothetical protein